MSLPNYNIEAIKHWKETPPTPFLFNFDNTRITVEKILCFLPGKRLVAKVQKDNKTALAKCFFGSSASAMQEKK